MSDDLRNNAADSRGKPIRGKLSTEQSVELTGRIAELAKAGLPLPGGLRALADELANNRLSRVLQEMADRLESGATLEEALAAQDRRFPHHVRQLVLAGIRSGQLAEVLEELVDLKREQLEVRRRVWVMLGYPITLLSLLSAVFILLHYLVVDEFAAIYKDFELGLPETTKLVLAVSGPAVWIMAGMTVSLIAVVLLLATLPNSVFASRCLHAVPLLGSVWRWNRLSQCSRLMAVLLGQKVALPQALQLTAGGVEDPDLAQGCRELAAEVEQGRPLAESLASKRQFPPSMVPLIDWGQQSSALDEAFRGTAEMFQGRAQAQSVMLQTIALPVVYLWVTLLVITYVLAVLRPLVTLIDGLSS